MIGRLSRRFIIPGSTKLPFLRIVDSCRLSLLGRSTTIDRVFVANRVLPHIVRNGIEKVLQRHARLLGIAHHRRFGAHRPPREERQLERRVHSSVGRRVFLLPSSLAPTTHFVQPSRLLERPSRHEPPSLGQRVVLSHSLQVVHQMVHVAVLHRHGLRVHVRYDEASLLSFTPRTRSLRPKRHRSIPAWGEATHAETSRFPSASPRFPSHREAREASSRRT